MITQINPRSQFPMLYNMYNGSDTTDSQPGIPKSLFDILINRKMGFNLGDKGYLNVRLPRGFDKQALERSGVGLNVTYDF